jgi:hypothetical protein
MTETDQKLEDAVLKRMLETPPTPHKEKAPARRQNCEKNEALGRPKSR